MTKKCFFLFWLLYSPFLFFAQIDAAFITHLSEHDLKAEHRAYLDQLTPAGDSFHYFNAKYHLQYGEDSLFLENFRKAPQMAQRDTALIQAAGLRSLVSKDPAFQRAWFSSLPPGRSSTAGKFQAFYLAALHPETYDGSTFSPEIRRSFLAYKKTAAKKPVVAGVLSAVLPGAGKLYAGKSRSALFNFLMNAGYAAQTFESYRKLGAAHPFTIINAGMFTVFYLANVYGSYKSILDLRKETKKQFLYDAARYY